MFNLASYPDQEPGYEAMSTLSTSALYQHNKVSHAQVDDHTHSLTMSHTHQHKINIQWNLNTVTFTCQVKSQTHAPHKLEASDELVHKAFLPLNETCSGKMRKWERSGHVTHMRRHVTVHTNKYI